MFSVLKSLLDEQTFVCIHTDELNPDKFIFGKIIGVDQDYFAVSMVSPDGEYDGIIIKLIDDIVYVEQAIGYKNKMARLMKANGYIDDVLSVTSGSILQWGLNWAKDKNHITSIELNHSGIDNVVGYIDYLNEDFCKVYQVDEFGDNDGVSHLMMRHITQICFGSCDEKRLQTLVDSNKA